MSTIDSFCLPANPDVSGPGVRAAIYAQNILSFIPAFYALSDGKVTISELDSIEVQSSTILITALAILVSAVVEGITHRLSNIHAAIILNLSWMNNTNLFIYFLLYLHHTAMNSESRDAALTWRFWWNVMWRFAGRVQETSKDPEGKGKESPEGRGGWAGWLKRVLRREKYTGSANKRQSPDVFVFLLGTIHLSLMAVVGVWLWSSPSAFDSSPERLCSMPPSLVVLGHGVPITSDGLRGFSIFMYTLVLVPVLNVFIPVALIVLFYTWFNRRYQTLPPKNTVFSRIVSLLSLQSPFKDAEQKNYEIFPISICLLLLAITNILFLVDTEVTLHQNQALQEPGESDWTFGQTLAVLLLLIPLRDVFESFIKRREEKVQDRIARAHEATSELGDALGKGDLAMIQKLLEEGANIDWQDKKGVSLVHWAAHNGHFDLVKYLKANGALLDLKDDEGQTPAWRAAAQGHYDILNYLGGEKSHLDVQDQNGKSPLCWAASSGNLDVVKHLVDKGVELNMKDKHGECPLWLAAKGGHIDVLKCLYDHGAWLDLKDMWGHTVLSWVAKNGKMEMMKILHDDRVWLNEPYGREGWSTLMWAVYYSHLDMVQFLHEQGAWPDLEDEKGKTPLMLAAMGGYVDVVKYLAEYDSLIDHQDEDGMTALHLSMNDQQQRNPRTVKCLVDCGAQLDIQDKWGDTPLHRAAIYGNLEIVQYLVDKGVPVDAKNSDDETPLDQAEERDHTEIMEYLTEKMAQLELELARDHPELP